METQEARKRMNPWLKALLWVGGVCVGLVILIVVALSIITGMLTDKRATDYFNQYAGEYFNADFHARKVGFTIWSTFPRFCLEIDSLQVNSRALDNLPDDIRKALPANADSLCYIEHVKGSLNVMKLLKKDEWWFHELSVKGATLNLVAVNDTLANYDILPKNQDSRFVMPFFTIEKMHITDLHKITYTGAAVLLRCSGSLQSLSLERKKDSLTDYNLAMKGKICADVDKFNIIDNKAFGLGGEVKLHFDPFKVKFSDFTLDMPGVGKVSLGMEVGEKDGSLNRLDCDISTFDVMALWAYVSEKYFPSFRNLVSSLQIESSVKLTSPWTFDSEGKPDLNVDIQKLHIAGNELDLDASARIHDLLGEPEVNADLQGLVELPLLKKYIPALTGWDVGGEADGNINLSFSLSDKGKELECNNVSLSGTLATHRLSCGNKRERFSIEGRDVKIKFSSDAPHFANLQDLQGESLDFSVGMGSANVSIPAMQAHVDSLSAWGRLEALALAKGDGTAIDGMPTKVNLSAAHAGLRFPGDTASLGIDRFRMNAVWDTLNYKKGKPGDGLKVHLSGDSLHYDGVANSVHIRSFQIGLASKDGSKRKKIRSVTPPSSRFLDSVYHTSEYLFIDPSPGFLDFMKKWDVALMLKARDGYYLNKAYPVMNYLTGLALEANFDSVVLHKVAVKSQSTRFDISGKIRHLREWLLKDKGTPLVFRLNLALDTLDFNQIARTYETGQKISGKSTAPPTHPVIVAADTVALLVPRNLDIDIHATAKATKYTNLDLYDLSTDFRVKNGDASIDSLRIYASFGKGLIGVRYHTANVENMSLEAYMALQDINVVKFFEKYTTLLGMMPEMANLSGIVNLDLTGSVNLFPNMYMDINSMRAEAKASGLDLLVRQNKFIRHITKMMLIPYGGDLHIKNIYASADVHDNLLELHPFDVEFFKYKIRMMGINDFQGHLNYHISVLRTPLFIPIKFGINVRGMYHKPKFSFGRHYDVRDTQERMNIYDNDKMNALSELTYFLKKFIHNASSSDSTVTRYVFPTGQAVK